MQGGTTKLDVNFGKNFEADSLPSAPSAVDKSGKVIIKRVKIEKNNNDIELNKKRSSIITRASIERKRMLSNQRKEGEQAPLPSPPISETNETLSSQPPPPSYDDSSLSNNVQSENPSGNGRRKQRRSVAVLSKRGLKLQKNKQNKKTGGGFFSRFFSNVWLSIKKLFGCTRHTNKSDKSNDNEKKRPTSARVDLATLSPNARSSNMFSGANPYSNFNDNSYGQSDL